MNKIVRWGEFCRNFRRGVRTRGQRRAPRIPDVVARIPINASPAGPIPRVVLAKRIAVDVIVVNPSERRNQDAKKNMTSFNLLACRSVEKITFQP
jgi:hypothetical protein